MFIFKDWFLYPLKLDIPLHILLSTVKGRSNYLKNKNISFKQALKIQIPPKYRFALNVKLSITHAFIALTSTIVLFGLPVFDHLIYHILLATAGSRF